MPPTLSRAIERIRADREHGASELARQAAEALERATGQPCDDPAATLRGIQAGARALARVRPSMAILANTVARIWHAGVETPSDDATTRLASLHAEAAHMRSIQGVEPILDHARPLLDGTIFTHSRSGTAEMILKTLIEEGQLKRCLVTESRPGGEGIALAQVLGATGAQVTLVADAACGHFVAEADMVVVGADSVRAEGGVMNKIGTYPLALAARAAGVPVYVLAEVAKIAPPMLPLVFEEMAPEELLPEPLPSVTARNVYFDYTPAQLIAAVITEAGPLDQAAIATRAAYAGAALAALLDASMPPNGT
jgi:translation initiation factor 2B subunit (eIF-2B alpha/beta/delta family)